MSEENTKIDQAEIAQHARALLNNPAYKLAIQTLKDEYTKQMLLTEYSDFEKRDALFLAINILKDVEAALTIFITSAKITELNHNRLTRNRSIK